MTRTQWMCSLTIAAALAPAAVARAQTPPQKPAESIEFTAADLANELNTAGAVRVRVQFDERKATIQPESSKLLSQIGDVLKSTPGLRLDIQGHTDNEGTPAENLKLSQERAAAVKAYLVQKVGIAANRLTTTGFGDTKPIADNSTEEGRAKNRRVELVKR